MVKLLFDAEFNLQDGSLISGPVTTEDDSEFLFRSINSPHELFFSIKLIDESWQFVNGSEGLGLFDEIIETVGKQIEAYYLSES